MEGLSQMENILFGEAIWKNSALMTFYTHIYIYIASRIIKSVTVPKNGIDKSNMAAKRKFCSDLQNNLNLIPHIHRALFKIYLCEVKNPWNVPNKMPVRSILKVCSE
jgi:hypothetical protein